MWKKIIRNAIMMAVLFSMTAQAGTADIPMDGEHDYKAVRLTPPIYQQANQNLADLLVLNKDGNPVPYFIHQFEITQTQETVVTYPLILMDSFQKDGNTFADFSIDKSLAPVLEVNFETDGYTDILATSICLETSSDMFAKNITLHGSYDGISWDFIQNDTLYRVDEHEKSVVMFGKPLKYLYYRIGIINSKGDLPIIQNAWLEYSKYTATQTYFIESMEPRYEIEEQERVTVIKLYDLKNVRIHEVTLETDSTFKRSVGFAGQRSDLYNLSFHDNVYRDTTLDFNGFYSNSDVLEIQIYNEDDKPIQIDHITLSYFADEVIFKGEDNGKYILTFGDASILNPPVYDIVNYKEFILNDGYDLLMLENFLEDILEDNPEPPDYSMVFNIVIIFITILLFFIILVRLKPVNKR